MSGVKGRTRVVTNRGLRPNKAKPGRKMPHKYLADPLESASEAPDDYTIEEGVLVGNEERPTARKAYDEWTRYWRPTSEEMRAEEDSWAAKSGPCVTIKKGHAA